MTKLKPKQLSDGIVKGNVDPRHHYYVTRCIECPKWIEHHDMAPITAERAAHRHAQRRPGHTAYVIDVHTLSVLHRYRFDALERPNGPTDRPPF